MQPTRVGTYEIEAQIGAGGMGTVYLGRREDGSPVAVKVLPASLAREEGFIARFGREIEAMRQVANPHVVEIYDSGRDGDTYYYAMEYVDGETLTARLKREKRIPWREAVEISLQICTALKAAHDAGIIHRDLKPSNLLLTADGTVKLTDFGVAQVFAGTKLTATGGIIGTAEYMSPEQAQGKRVTRQSDLYSLGAVIYVMLTGRPPFSGKTGVEVIQKHRFGQFDKPRMIVPDLPLWLDEIVCQLLEKEPEKRFPDAYVLSLRLREVIKKVELSAEEATMASNVGSQDSSPTSSGEGGYSGPGEATMMRDLMRAEIERAQFGTPLQRTFNNIWVLLGSLLLLVSGGVWWFGDRGMSPQQRFEMGVAALDQKEGPGWLAARDEYLIPLVEEDPDYWAPKVAPHLERVEFYEFKSAIESKRRLGQQKVPDKEPRRWVFLARHYRDTGQYAAAEEVLTALERLLAEQPEFVDLHQLTVQELAGLQEKRADVTGRDTMLKAALERAGRLQSAGQSDEAAKIYAAILTLYADDPHVAETVRMARRNLADERISTAESGRSP